MSLRDMITFNTAVSGIQQTVQNLASIRAARKELERKNEISGLTIQEKKLGIQKQALANNMTAMEQRFLEEQLKELEKISKAETTAVSGKIDITEITEKNKLGQLTNDARISAPGAARMVSLMGLDQEGGEQDPEYSDVAQNLNPNLPRLSYRKNMGPFTLSMGGGRKAAAEKTDPVIKLMGTLDTKKNKEGDVLTKEDAMDMASRELGYGWQAKYPQVNALIEKRYADPGIERLKAMRPDEHGYKVGEGKRFPGKGYFEYIGNNQWKRNK